MMEEYWDLSSIEVEQSL